MCLLLETTSTSTNRTGNGDRDVVEDVTMQQLEELQQHTKGFKHDYVNRVTLKLCGRKTSTRIL